MCYSTLSGGASLLHHHHHHRRPQWRVRTRVRGRKYINASPFFRSFVVNCVIVFFPGLYFGCVWLCIETERGAGRGGWLGEAGAVIWRRRVTDGHTPGERQVGVGDEMRYKCSGLDRRTGVRRRPRDPPAVRYFMLDWRTEGLRESRSKWKLTGVACCPSKNQDADSSRLQYSDHSFRGWGTLSQTRGEGKSWKERKIEDDKDIWDFTLFSVQLEGQVRLGVERYVSSWRLERRERKLIEDDCAFL